MAARSELKHRQSVPGNFLLVKMAGQHSRAFNANLTLSSKSPSHKSGCNLIAFSSWKALSVKRSRASSVVVAASNPVAAVEKTLKKTASTVADKIKDVTSEVKEDPKGLNLNEIILLQGALALDGLVQSNHAM